MVRVSLLLALLLSSGISSAQTEQYLKPGLLEASATYSPSVMLGRDESNFYISGFAEYHMDNKVSFRGDTYLYVLGQNDFPLIDQAIRTYFGLFYHFNQGNFDYSIGFQPGMVYMNWNPYAGGIETFAPIEANPQLMPSFALTTGVSYYVWKYFNFFANVTYVNSNLSGTPTGVVDTDELLISAGLGFQIQTRKSK